MRPAATTSNSPPFNMASAPTVYRSLPLQLAVPASPLSVMQQPNKGVELFPPRQKELITAAGQQDGKQVKTTRFPVATFPGLIQNPIVKENVDLTEMHKALAAVCASCELKKTSTICEFSCTAHAADGNEQCKFSVSLWDIPHSATKCLIQVDRHAGCPFFFREIVAKAIGTCSMREEAGPKPQGQRLFRAPKLPESLREEEESKPDISAVESAISLATSNVYEQRIQGALVLADLCTESKAFAELFKSVNGVERIQIR